MPKNKFVTTIIVLSAVLCISMYFNIVSRSENKRYESFLSEQEIGNKLRPMGAHIILAKSLLEKVVKEGAVTSEEVQQLHVWYGNFSSGMQDLIYLYSRLERGGEMANSSFLSFNKIYTELGLLDSQMYNAKESRHVLDSSEIVMMLRIQKYTNRYADVFGSDYDDWSYDIKDKKWVEVLRELYNVSRINVDAMPK